MKKLAAIFILALVVLFPPPSEAVKKRIAREGEFKVSRVETRELPRINDVYVVHFVIDGTNLRTFDRTLAEGKLPNIHRMLVEGGARFTQALSSFPTTSTTVYQSYVSGLLPGRSGIPHLERFDRESGEVISYLSAGGPKKLNDDFFNSRALFNPEVFELTPPSTIFELLRGHPTAAVYSSIYRGASHVHPKKAPIRALLSTYVTGNPQKVDMLAFREIMSLFRGENIPRYLLAGLYSSDILGHLHGPGSPEVSEALVQFDFFLGDFYSLLEERGIADRTYIIVSADHGMHGSALLFDLHKKLEEAGVAVRSEKPKHKNFTLYAANRGVSSSHFYVRHDGKFRPISDPEILRKHPRVGGGTVDLVELILSLDATDLLIVRAGDRKASIHNRDGLTADIACYPIARMDHCSYSFDRSRGDPLGLSSNPGMKHLLDGLPHSTLAWRAASAEGTYPDAVIQLSQIFGDGRAGDAFITTLERFGFRKVKAGNHGGPTEDDMRVPLFIAGPDVPRGKFGVARSVDIYPLLISWFNLHVPKESHDGVNPFVRHSTDRAHEKLAALDLLFDNDSTLMYTIDVPGFVRREVFPVVSPNEFSSLLPIARGEARLRSEQLAKVRRILASLEAQAREDGAPEITDRLYLEDHTAIVKRAKGYMESGLRRMEDIVSVLEKCRNPGSGKCFAL